MASQNGESSNGFEGKVAVVTGATTGIGEAIAHKLAARGCQIVLTGLTGPGKTAEDFVEEFQNIYKVKRFYFIPADFSDLASTEKFCQDVLKLFPKGVDILSSNAGVPARGLVEEFPLEEWQWSLAINLTAPFLLTKAFVPHMKEKGWGRLVYMSSQMGLIAEVAKSGYCTIKSGLIGFARAVALEGAQYGITSNAVCPSFVDAPMCHSQIDKLVAKTGKTYEECKEDFARERHPGGKLIPAEDVADLVLYLCTDSAKFISGTPVPIDGCSMAR